MGIIATTGRPQPTRALSINIPGTPYIFTVTIIIRSKLHGHVEPFQKGDIIIVLVGQGVLGQSARLLSVPRAGKLTAAVAGLASTVPGRVKVAAGSGPDASQSGASVGGYDP